MLRKVVHTDNRLVGYGHQVVEQHTALRSLVERREIDPVVAQRGRRGDGRGAFHQIVGRRGAVQLRNTPADIGNRHGQQVGLVDGQFLDLARAVEIFQFQGHGIRDGLAGRNREFGHR